MKRTQLGSPRGIRIRPCRERDLAGVLALWKRAEAVPSVTDTVPALRRRLRRDRQLFLLAWDREHLIGSIVGGWDGWRGSIARLAVDRAYRRRGVAARLVRTIEKRLRALGATRIRCVVLRRNGRARAFWSAAGYGLSRGEVTFVKDVRVPRAARR